MTLTGPLTEELKSSGDGASTPLSDTPLPDLLDALVNGRDRVVAAEALKVNHRTMSACYESRRVSRRMRRALEEYRVGDADGDEQDDDAGDVAEVAAALEKENRALREAVEAQAEPLCTGQVLTRSRQGCSLLGTFEVIRGVLASSRESVA